MIKQFLSPGIEREILQGLAQEYECPVCIQPITNPICHSCLTEQIGKWLEFYPSIRQKILPKIKKYAKEIDNEASGSIICTSCRKRNATLCPYCFSEEIFNIFKRNRIDKMVIMDFLSVFHSDSDHEEYYKGEMK